MDLNSYSSPASTISTSSSSSQSPESTCLVCTAPSNGVYYGVPSCAACASFFRRSAIEKRQYVCQWENNCSIHSDGMRNSCRACRYRLCLELGMCLDRVSKFPKRNVGQALNRMQKTISSASTMMTAPVAVALAQPEPMTTHSAFESVGSRPLFQSPVNINDDTSAGHSREDFDVNIPAAANLTQQFAHSLKILQNGHRALVHVVGDSYSQTLLNGLRLVTLEECLQMHRGFISLVLAFLREHFPQLDQLQNQTKVQILRVFNSSLCFMSSAEMTLKSFPEQNGELMQYMLHPGCIVDRNRLDHFFANCDSREEHIKQFRSTFLDKVGHILFRRYKQLDISSMEFAALVGLKMWNCIDQHISLPAELLAKRDQLFAELHSLVGQRIGIGISHSLDFSAIGIRFGQLLEILHAIDVLNLEMEDTFTMLKIFLPLPLPTDIWEDLHFENAQKVDADTDAVNADRISVQ